MKRFLQFIIIMLVLLVGANYYVFATDANVEIYEEEVPKQESIFEFEQESLAVDSLTQLKLNTNLEISEEDIIWSVSDEGIANISNGKIKPLNNGKVIVTAEYLPLDLKATCTVNVKFVVGITTLNVYANTYNSLKITYTKQTNATHYEIQRATSKNGKYKTVVITSSTSYVDKSLKCGTIYYYRVRAINENNNIKSSYSLVKSKKVIPAKISVTTKKVKSYNSTQIKWNKVSGASGYRVYRSTSKNGKYERLVTTTSLNYTDKNLESGKTYYYKVRAYRLVDGTKVFGTYCDVFTLKPTLSKPKVNIYQYGIKVNIKINQVNEATGYDIYRATSENGKYTKIATTKSLWYKDSKIIFTYSYYYKVRAYKVVGGKKIYSSYTEPVHVKTYIPNPGITLRREGATTIKVSWGKVKGVDGYEIHMSDNGQKYNLLKSISDYRTTSYTKSNLEINNKYCIKIRCYKILNGEKIYGNFTLVKTCILDEFLQALKVKTNYNVRSNTSGSYKTVGQVKKNQIVVSYGREGNYYKIKVNNKLGYIHKNYVTLYNDAKVLGLSNINQFSNQGGPILPTGCEVTSLAVVLRYLGFNSVTKNLLADKYQPRGVVGKTDPNVAFVGTPYSSKPYGCYAPVIVKTAENYFSAIRNSNYKVNDLTGMNIEDIYKQIDKGNPLIMWMTYGKPYYQTKWTLDYGTKTTKEGTGEYKFTWYGLQHCVAVAGYNKKKNTLIIADVAQSGELTEYSISYLKPGYNKLGKQLVSITKK